MSFSDFFTSNPMAFYGVVFLLGLLVGSFLNVVIYRLPLIMAREDTGLALEYLREYAPERLQKKQAELPEPISLSRPASHCRGCKTPIRAWQNIPLLSFARQKGRCPNCQCAISWQYPLVELATGILSLLIATHFGWGWQCFGALWLTWALIAASVIDYHTKLLPDVITLPCLWLGLLFNSYSVFVPLESAVYGAVFGYMSLWTVYQLFRLLTGKEGMGFGDFKLLAALGAWVGWELLLPIVLISSLLGAVLGSLWMLFKRQGDDNTIPFGPYLALAGWLCLLWGEELTQYYLGTMVS